MYRKVRLSTKDGTVLPHSIPLFLTNDWKTGKEFVVIKNADADSNVVLKAEPAALDVIEQIQKPIAVLGICGPYRHGKSYFMSQALDIPAAFTVAHTMRACTHGIMMATTILECDDHAIIFLDMEGTGAVGKDKTPPKTMNSLLVMVTLLSSYLIYNSVGVLNEPDVDQIRYLLKFPRIETSLV